jgi:hypothetical protein
VEIGRDMEDLVRRFHPIARKKKALSYFTGEYVAKFLSLYRFKFDILSFLHKVLIHKIFDRRQRLENRNRIVHTQPQRVRFFFLNHV